MINFKSFMSLINLLESSYNECTRINSNIRVLTQSSDTCSMYFVPYELVAKTIIEILQSEGETEEGAEWFVYEGMEQIKDKGTEITVDKKTYKIKTMRDYYDYLSNLKK